MDRQNHDLSPSSSIVCRRSPRLACDVIGTLRCSLRHRNPGRKQAARPDRRSATSVESRKKTLLHRIVREHLATFLADAAERYPSGDIPAFIRAEFERYLRCGILCHGFARVRCPTCRDELLVAFSCKKSRCVSVLFGPAHGRYCGASSTAFCRRCPCANGSSRFPNGCGFCWFGDPLISLALRLFLRALLPGSVAAQGGKGSRTRCVAQVTMIQRFGSALNFSLHFHTLVPDGVFFEDGDGEVQFQAHCPADPK